MSRTLQRRWIVAAGLAAVLGALLTARAAAPPMPAAPGAPEGVWNFRAALDGQPIGHHRFSVDGQGNQREVHSDADFAVKVIGITAYHYVHQAHESWRDGCLVAMTATTDANGDASAVKATAGSGGLSVKGGGALRNLSGCVMSFAYWNPAIRGQQHLLNAQTGRFEAVRVAPAGSGSIEVRGQAQRAQRWRISGPEHPIDVWYADDGRWIGLDSTLEGGRKLTYRLE